MTFRAWGVRGSSPLARGLRRANPPSPGMSRIIPARAGFTSPRPAPTTCPTDHPRSRGVYQDGTTVLASVDGSSPLARGLRRVARPATHHHGIIPARAGFTPPGAASAGSRWDHPRSRGVYITAVFTAVSGFGSSPLARGLRALRPAPAQPVRIIPARAGFTGYPRPCGRRCKDHPRSRGVYCWPRKAGPISVGSSPLARGLHDRLPPVATGRRIIPARAGFTEQSAGGGSGGGDHPRSRGVYIR